jgi:site-specific DNA-methyltransferase (adenine-specific)
MQNNLPDKCANLIIADPPYFEVKGDFDFVWASFDDYLKDVERWAVECKRILADNGTILWYGHAKKIAYTQVIFDKHFNLENNIAIEFNRQTKKGVDVFRCFAPVSERLLMYSLDSYNLTGCLTSIRDYIRSEILRAKGKISFKEINKAFGTATNGGGVASACLSLQKTEPAMLTKEMYEKLREWLNAGLRSEYEYLRSEYEYLRSEYEYLRSEYEYLRSEYEELRRPFNNQFGLFDIMKFDQEAHITGKYDHDTVKPETLTRALILTCSRPDNLIVIPFSGSGTEAAMCAKEGRRFIAYELTERHVKMGQNRVENILSKPTLFAA